MSLPDSNLTNQQNRSSYAWIIYQDEIWFVPLFIDSFDDDVYNLPPITSNFVHDNDLNDTAQWGMTYKTGNHFYFFQISLLVVPLMNVAIIFVMLLIRS